MQRQGGEVKKHGVARVAVSEWAQVAPHSHAGDKNSEGYLGSE